MNPVITRMEEHRKRDDVYKAAMERFANYTRDVQSIKRKMNWVPESNITTTYNLINDEKQKLEEIYKVQVGRELHMDPVFTLDLVRKVD